MGAARRLGLDIAGHASRLINAGLVRDADLIVVMEQGQKEALQAEFPENAHKVHLLSEAGRLELVENGCKPVDVDKPADLVLVERVLREQGRAL